MNLVQKNIKAINALCQTHNVKQLYLFGSVLTDKFNAKSDIDLLITFSEVEPFLYFDNFMSLKEHLESTLKRPVDLLEDQAIKNPVLRKVIDREKVFIYERKDIEVPV